MELASKRMGDYCKTYIGRMKLAALALGLLGLFLYGLLGYWADGPWGFLAFGAIGFVEFALWPSGGFWPFRSLACLLFAASGVCVLRALGL